MCLNHPCYESLNRFAASKPARIFYGTLLVIIVTVFCWRLLQASDQLQVQREREASRLEVIPHTKSGLIMVHARNTSEIEKWKASIDKSLMAYSRTNSVSSLKDCSYNDPISSDKSCDIDLRSFGPCSAENFYGYSKNSPCIFLKFKKVNDWVPKNFNMSDLPMKMPQDLKNTIENSNRPNVWLSCEGENPVDTENVGPIAYYPDRGYPSFFFPYTGQTDYLEPIVAVQLERPASGIVIMVKCTAWSGDFQDSIKFEVMVE